MSTFPTDTEIDVMTLATRQLNQLHASLDVDDTTVKCNHCGAGWLCSLVDDKLKLTELHPGNGSCEAEALRIISTAGLYSELGRRRLAKRKTVTRAGGRPRKIPGTEGMIRCTQKTFPGCGCKGYHSKKGGQ